MTGRWRLPFVSTCSDDGRPYMILVALIKAFQNRIGFAIIRAFGKEWQRRDHDNPPERVNPFVTLISPQRELESATRPESSFRPAAAAPAHNTARVSLRDGSRPQTAAPRNKGAG